MLPRLPAALLSLSSLFVLCCGGQSASRNEGDGPGSGKRLRAVTLESARGTGVFQYFEDTELGLHCNFVETDPGTWRCLPAGPAMRHVGGISYTDPWCTEPVGAFYRNNLEGPYQCTPPRHVVTGDDCGTTPEVFEIGSRVSADAFYSIQDGECTYWGDSTLATPFAVERMPLEAFALGQLKIGAETEGVVPLDVSDDEGSGVRIGFRDAAEGFDCHLAGGDDDSRCVPEELGLISGFFADSGCTEPAARLHYCSDARTEILFAHDATNDTYYRGGLRRDGSFAAVTGTTECVSTIAALFAIGSEVPITHFASGRRTRSVDGDLVTTIDSVGEASLPPRTLESTAHGGHECFAARGRDGTLRCLPPPEFSPSGFFADAACTEPVEQTDAEVLSVAVAGVCPPELHVFARGDLHLGPLYESVDGSCILTHETPPSPGQFGGDYYVFSTEIQASEFTPLFEVTR